MRIVSFACKSCCALSFFSLLQLFLFYVSVSILPLLGSIHFLYIHIGSRHQCTPWQLREACLQFSLSVVIRLEIEMQAAPALPSKRTRSRPRRVRTMKDRTLDGVWRIGAMKYYRFNYFHSYITYTLPLAGRAVLQFYAVSESTQEFL